jgi:hypothetical protein
MRSKLKGVDLVKGRKEICIIKIVQDFAKMTDLDVCVTFLDSFDYGLARSSNLFD